jgi:hypothetical protein
LAMDEFLTRVRRCGRGLTRGGKKRAHLTGRGFIPPFVGDGLQRTKDTGKLPGLPMAGDDP